MNALVTGGAGFIGSHLVDSLLSKGDSVVVLDNLSAGKHDNLAHLKNHPHLFVQKGAADNEQTLAPLIEKAEIVFHLAAILGVPRVCLEPARTLETNFLATRAVVRLCREHRVKMVLASTSEAYGKTTVKPVNESDDAVFGPSSVPRWAYALSKLADEYLVQDLMKEVPAVIIRFFNIYGPRQDPLGSASVIPRLTRQALTSVPLTIFSDGRQTRSFTYVSDAVAGILAAAAKADRGVFNIGRPKETTINALAEMIIGFSGSRSLITYIEPPPEWGRFEEQRERLPDITRARDQLGFQPTMTLHEGLIRTIEWMKRDVLHLEERKAG